LPISLSSILLLICDAAWLRSIITILKLKTVREIRPLVIAEHILLAVLASIKLSQCKFNFIALPVGEKSNCIIKNENSKKHKAIMAGRNAMLVMVFL
jgi:hypothetical protein